MPEQKRKDINNMFFRINVLSKDGDKVKVNILSRSLKRFLDSGADMPQIQGKDVLNNVDFKQIFRS